MRAAASPGSPTSSTAAPHFSHRASSPHAAHDNSRTRPVRFTTHTTRRPGTSITSRDEPHEPLGEHPCTWVVVAAVDHLDRGPTPTFCRAGRFDELSRGEVLERGAGRHQRTRRALAPGTLDHHRPRRPRGARALRGTPRRARRARRRRRAAARARRRRPRAPTTTHPPARARAQSPGSNAVATPAALSRRATSPAERWLGASTSAPASFPALSRRAAASRRMGQGSLAGPSRTTVVPGPRPVRDGGVPVPACSSRRGRGDDGKRAHHHRRRGRAQEGRDRAGPAPCRPPSQLEHGRRRAPAAHGRDRPQHDPRGRGHVVLDHPTAHAARAQHDADLRTDAHVCVEGVGNRVVECLVQATHVGEHPHDALEALRRHGGSLTRRRVGGPRCPSAYRPRARLRSSTLGVASQVNSLSERPKCP